MSLPELERLKEYSFEIGPIRPPSEGGSRSLLIRATRNCPWNLCKFCYGTPYNRERFQLRSAEEIKRDIDTAKAISELIKVIAKKLGGMDWAARLIDPHFLCNKDFMELDEKESKNFQSVVNVFNWLHSGAKSAFLQDANSLVMRTNELVEVIRYLKQAFPSLERITSYARAKTLAQKTKTLEELKELRKAGLSRLHVGLETGDDELLKYVNKGVTSEEHVLAGRKAKEAGFELSEYWMPSLGGKTMSEQHARNTARVLNEINPDFVRSRRFVPRKATSLFEEWRKGEFQLLSPHEELREIQTMIENLEITGKVCFDHFINPAYRMGSDYVWLFKQDYDGYKFPEEKPKVLDLIKYGLGIDESLFTRAEDLVELSL
ncbi:MAG: Radical SAM superfamily protein [Candidatus Bathyarchaeota archaeon BA2]|nr:MAG: Radical SAM superfamily protein [Candidatus Bathyarchaeota archaeon BA2]